MMNNIKINVLKSWHQIAKDKDTAALKDIIADNAIFHSPVVHTPQEGKIICIQYLKAAFAVLFNDSFKYTKEISSANKAMLEFELELDGISINGVDIIEWDETGKIIDFKVMIRPLKAINIIQIKMAEEFSSKT